MAGKNVAVLFFDFLNRFLNALHIIIGHVTEIRYKETIVREWSSSADFQTIVWLTSLISLAENLSIDWIT